MSESLARGAVARGPTDLYRAVWRWHFYAGLLVLPFLILLSITGGLYLFRGQLDPIIHAPLMRVAPRTTPVQPPSAQLAAALASQPGGTAFRYVPAPAPDRASEIGLRHADGTRRVVYVDPHDARVLGSLSDRGTAMWWVRQLHSLKLVGPWARYLIEIAAGWTVLLVGTGLFLWWPRRDRGGEPGGVVTVRGTPKRRVFWRDLHAVTGLAVGGVLVFLAVTGMPWSSVWGSYVNQAANGSNFGYPTGLRVAVPMSEQRLTESGPTSWSLEQALVPQSGGHDGHAGHGTTAAAPPVRGAIGLDAAVAAFEKLGLARGYAVALPSGPKGVYTGSVYPSELEQQRVVHLDQYSGRPLLDMRWAEYGPLGRLLEWGINIHLGQQWGLANQLVLLAVCLATVLMCVSAGVMWWKRRPAGSLGVPPMPRDRAVLRGLLAILAVGGVIFPLVGLSLVVMLALDWALFRRPALRLKTS